MLSHGNFIGMLAAGKHIIIDIDSSDVVMSYIPMPHVYEHMKYWCATCKGCKVGVYGGDKLKL